MTGEKATVTDEEAIGLGGTIYVTPKQFEAIKARTIPAPLRPLRSDAPEEMRWREQQRRKYRYHYDRHVIDFRDFQHAEHMRRLREEQESQKRERDKAHIDAAEAKRQRKQAKRRALMAKEGC